VPESIVDSASSQGICGFAIEVLQACRTVKAAAAIPGLSWDSLQTINNRSVEQGLEEL
jgi:hypothetical protein